MCRKLLEKENNFVICVDNFMSGRESNIADLVYISFSHHSL
jgi:hypothetical protein